MKDFFQRLQIRMAQAMQGRRGADTLATFCMVVGLILMFVSLLPNCAFASWLALAAIVYACFRCYSKNIYKRQQENDAFERATEKPRHQLRVWYKKWKNRKTTLYFKCPGCGQDLSVPRGKGTLRVVCPKCKTETKKKS